MTRHLIRLYLCKLLHSGIKLVLEPTLPDLVILLRRWPKYSLMEGLQVFAFCRSGGDQCR